MGMAEFRYPLPVSGTNNRLGVMRLASGVKVPKNFRPLVFVKTSLTRDIDVIRWLHIEAANRNRDARFVLRLHQTGGMTVNDLIVEGLIVLRSHSPE